jgi:hypothetical protein
MNLEAFISCLFFKLFPIGKVYLEMYYNHQLGSVAVDENLVIIKAQELQIA